MAEPKQAVILDLEGVIVDHLKAQCNNATKALKAVGISFRVTPEMYQLRTYKPFHDTTDFLLGLAAMATQKISLERLKQQPELILQYREQFTRNLAEAIKTTGRKTFDAERMTAVKGELPWFRSLEFLHQLKHKGIPVFIVTAAQKAHVEKIVMEENGIVPRLVPRQNVLYGEDQKERGKEVLFAQVQNRLPKGTRFLVVEDSLSGIKIGQKLGMDTALVLTGNTGREMIKTLERPPTFVVNGVHELLGTAVPLLPDRIRELFVRWRVGKVGRRLAQNPHTQRAGTRIAEEYRNWKLRSSGRDVRYPKGMQKKCTHPKPVVRG